MHMFYTNLKKENKASEDDKNFILLLNIRSLCPTLPPACNFILGVEYSRFNNYYY